MQRQWAEGKQEDGEKRSGRVFVSSSGAICRDAHGQREVQAGRAKWRLKGGDQHVWTSASSRSRSR